MDYVGSQPQVSISLRLARTPVRLSLFPFKSSHLKCRSPRVGPKLENSPIGFQQKGTCAGGAGGGTKTALTVRLSLHTIPIPDPPDLSLLTPKVAWNQEQSCIIPRRCVAFCSIASYTVKIIEMMNKNFTGFKMLVTSTYLETSQFPSGS